MNTEEIATKRKILVVSLDEDGNKKALSWQQKLKDEDEKFKTTTFKNAYTEEFAAGTKQDSYQAVIINYNFDESY